MKRIVIIVLLSIILFILVSRRSSGMTKEEEAKKKQGGEVTKQDAAKIKEGGEVTKQDAAPKVTLFSDCNFAGKMADVSFGEYASMEKAGFANDVLSSMKIPAGVKVQVFEHDNFKGDTAVFTKDIFCLVNVKISKTRNWNDRVSSLKISKA